MRVSNQKVRNILKKHFNNIEIYTINNGLKVEFNQEFLVRIEVLSGRNQRKDLQGIHIHSLENRSELEHHLIDAVQVAERDMFSNIYIHNPLTEEEQREDDRIKGMQARIKAEIDEQHNALNILEASVLPGDVVQVGTNEYILVITKDRFQEASFYYTPCNFDGTLTIKQYKCSAANYIRNSIMLSKVALKAEIVNSIELETVKARFGSKSFEWHLTGDAAIDSYMSQLDARYALFCEACKPEDKNTYDKNEYNNYHSENGDFVTQFCSKYIVKGL